MYRKFLVTLGALAIAVIASTSFAGLLMDVVAVPGTGYAVADGGKTVILEVPGSLITFECFGTISGADANLTNEKLTQISGGFLQTRVAGNTSALSLPTVPVKGYIDPYISLAASNVTVTDTLIGLNGGSSATNAWCPRNNAAVNTTTGPTTYALGYFNLTAKADGTQGAGGLFTSVNYVKPAVAAFAYSFNIDGVSGTANNITIGAPVNVQAVPEPATLVLLGFGALALVFIRRRK